MIASFPTAQFIQRLLKLRDEVGWIAPAQRAGVLSRACFRSGRRAGDHSCEQNLEFVPLNELACLEGSHEQPLIALICQLKEAKHYSRLVCQVWYHP